MSQKAKKAELKLRCEPKLVLRLKRQAARESKSAARYVSLNSIAVDLLSDGLTRKELEGLTR